MSYGQAKNDQTQTLEFALKQQPLLRPQELEQPIQFVSVEIWVLSLPVETLW